MKKADLNEIKLMFDERLDAKLQPFLERFDKHGSRLANLEKFQVEIKAKMAMISGIAGTVSAAAVVWVKSMLTSK